MVDALGEVGMVRPSRAAEELFFFLNIRQTPELGRGL